MKTILFRTSVERVTSLSAGSLAAVLLVLSVLIPALRLLTYNQLDDEVHLAAKQEERDQAQKA